MNDHTTKQTTQEIPYGYCHCGCGQKTRIAEKTDRNRGWTKGKPIFYLPYHNNLKHAPAPPEYCECGCGQRLNQPSKPSGYKRFISGHNAKPHPVAPRLWKKVDKRKPDECWDWTGVTGTHGYGYFRVNGKSQLTHRITWELHNGPIPDGLHVLHKCDNKRCCNIAHLFLGTNQDNIDDMVRKGRQHHPEGAKGEANVTAKLTTRDVLEIRRRVASGENQHRLAEEFNVAQGHISSIVRRKTWKHI